MKQEGEAEMPSPPAVDLRRDWGVHLGQRLRVAAWIPGQVYLTGAMECRTPDPLYVLDIGGRYQINDRAVRAARQTLSELQRADMIAYQNRPDEYVSRLDQDGRGYWMTRPPEMRDEEADAFRALWRVLWDAGALRRLERTHQPTSPDHSEDL